ncbi:MAG: 2-amino-4-hydroxy-6-hydroxymethyldihydropteridine diphosphokinase [Bacteroidota bacterium]
MKSDIRRAYLLLGSNLGNREKLIAEALNLIAADVGQIVIKSSIYETAAWGRTDQPSFLNIAVAIDTILNPKQLLKKILAIEKLLGRIRHEKWGSRVIDIDIILYGNEIIDFGVMLKIPHPEMQHRKFVLQPLAEIAPSLIHPILNKSIMEMLGILSDTLTVQKR